MLQDSISSPFYLDGSQYHPSFFTIAIITNIIVIIIIIKFKDKKVLQSQICQL